MLGTVDAGEIGDLGTMLSLVLVLLPLFTAQRTSELRKLKREDDSPVRQSDLTVELWIVGGLLAITVILLAATWALLAAVLENWKLSEALFGDESLFRRDSAVHTVFVVSWILLVGLGVWQIHLFRMAWETRH